MAKHHLKSYKQNQVFESHIEMTRRVWDLNALAAGFFLQTRHFLQTNRCLVGCNLMLQRKYQQKSIRRVPVGKAVPFLSFSDIEIVFPRFFTFTRPSVLAGRPQLVSDLVELTFGLGLQARTRPLGRLGRNGPFRPRSGRLRRLVFPTMHSKRHKGPGPVSWQPGRLPLAVLVLGSKSSSWSGV